MKTVSLIIFIILAIISFNLFTFTVKENEQAIKLQFRKPVGGPIANSGLHLRKPFIQDIIKFEKRVLEWDGDRNQIPTKDKKYIWVDVTARWKIVDALKFYQTVRTENGAHTRLDDVIDGATRNVVSNHMLVEVVRNTNSILEKDNVTTDLGDRFELDKINFGREELTHEIFAGAADIVPQFGIELIDVKIKRLDYEDSVQQKVFERMISERRRIAEKLRSEGQGQRKKVLGKMEKEVKSIRSEAYRTAQEVKGKADAEVTNIYAKAYNPGKNFYKFLKTLESYDESIKEDSTVFLSTDSEYLKYFKEYR